MQIKVFWGEPMCLRESKNEKQDQETIIPCKYAPPYLKENRFVYATKTSREQTTLKHLSYNNTSLISGHSGFHIKVIFKRLQFLTIKWSWK